jgi:hypothetical protein
VLFKLQQSSYTDEENNASCREVQILNECTHHHSPEYQFDLSESVLFSFFSISVGRKLRTILKADLQTATISIYDNGKLVQL